MQTVIKQRVVAQDPWPRLAADETVCEARRAALHYRLQRASTLASDPPPATLGLRLGLQLRTDEEISLVQPWLSRIHLLMIEFPVFTDGRGFSLARAAREQGFTGDLRICGDFLPDQMYYLTRVGASSFLPPEGQDAEHFLTVAGGFSETYQAAQDTTEPLFRRRWQWHGVKTAAC